MVDRYFRVADYPGLSKLIGDQARCQENLMSEPFKDIRDYRLWYIWAASLTLGEMPNDNPLSGLLLSRKLIEDSPTYRSELWEEAAFLASEYLQDIFNNTVRKNAAKFQEYRDPQEGRK